jgi:hypothetical protein
VQSYLRQQFSTVIDVVHAGHYRGSNHRFDKSLEMAGDSPFGARDEP